MARSQPRLIVASNRLPIVVQRDDAGRWRVEPSVGGLVTALLPVLRAHRGTWIGWPGVAGELGDEIEAQLDESARDEGYRFAAVPLSEGEVNDFYRGFANEIVWPLFHDLFTNCVFEPRYWSSYVDVNRRFAHAIAARAHARDLVWVHDYHLMNVAAELRALGVANRVGFFLHVPFPGPDIFFKLPWRDEIIAGLLAFNQLGFQTERDQRNFLECARRLAGPIEEIADVSGTCLRTLAVGATAPGPRLGPSEVIAGSFPIGIDFDDFAGRAATPGVEALAAHLMREFRGRKIYLGVDRLDYSKGLPQKLGAFRLALERYPDMHKYVTLVQHVVPSREDVPDYHRQRLEIEGIVGEINGTFGEPGWTPVHYYYHTLSPEELLAYYRSSHAALITSLKDGMNLVAKEYCACRLEDDGVLILSEFAGAAAEFEGAALMVNPFDVEGVARRIREAYDMPQAEQRTRMKALRRSVRENDVHRWASRCLAASAQARCRPRSVAGLPGTGAGAPNPEPTPGSRRSNTV